MAASTQTVKSTLTMLLCSAALAGCSGNADTSSTAGGAAPPPGEIVVINHGLPEAQEALPQNEASVLAPTALKPDETLMAAAPPLQEGVPQPLDAPVVIAAPVPVQEATAVTIVPPVAEADRIAALEKEVQALRADYNAMMPAFNGLITTNERIQVLLKDLEKQVGVKAGVVPSTPASDASVPVSSTPTAVSADGPVVSGLRLGEHGDKTRLVLDVSAITEYTTALDNAQKQLVITLPAAGWAGKGGVEGLGAPLVAGWKVQPGEAGGSVVIVTLKKDARIVSTERLKAADQGPARIVIDIAAGAAS